MGFLAGKRFLITGVLSSRSIAYGIAKACKAQGAELAFSYVGERFRERITDFAAEFDSKLVFARPSAGTSSTACRAKASASPTTSRPTVSRQWPRPPCPTCGRIRRC
jgi:enoyl-[acyl-carrier-protein] reductase (NADH)